MKSWARSGAVETFVLAISRHFAFPEKRLETLKMQASGSFPEPFRGPPVRLRVVSPVVALVLDVPQPSAPASHVGFHCSFVLPFAAVGMQCKPLAR